jgi:hypothetical protein
LIRIPTGTFAEIQKEINQYGDAARPDLLPLPCCIVKMVCGPPCAGKSTYVREHARPGDTVIDIDSIAKEHGYGRDRPADVTGLLLLDRNQRLAALAHKPPEHVAWVILTAPSQKLRGWWQDRLNVPDENLVLLVPTREELHARLAADPERKSVASLHRKLIGQWFERERTNTASRIVRGCDATGWPSDPLHSWQDDND